MWKAEFRPLQLPPSVPVPSGAVDHSSDPGKDHAVFSAVKLLGGGYACVENCGIVEGGRQRKKRVHSED